MDKQAVLSFWIIFSLLLFIPKNLVAQSSNSRIGIQYSPHYSNVTNGVFNDDLGISHQLCIQYSRKTGKKGLLSIGFSYLNSAKVNVNKNPSLLSYSKLKNRKSMNYLIIPIGYKLRLDGFFIHPQIGFGYNTNNTTKAIDVFTNGGRDVDKYPTNPVNGVFNPITIPVFFSAGYEWSVRNFIFSGSLSSYFSTTETVEETEGFLHLFGVGVVFGVELSL